MAKLNCWEFKKCGREPAGAKEKELGVCPVAVAVSCEGLHGGKGAGRVCWAVAGSLCGGKVQGTFAEKVGNCIKCEFYQIVVKDEGKDMVPVSEVIRKLEKRT